MANFCSNNSDGKIWAFYSTYLTLDRNNPGIGLIHFVKKYYCSALLEWLTIELYICVVDNVYAVYHCKGCFYKTVNNNHITELLWCSG